MLRGVLACVAALLLAVPASASALTLRAERPETGWIRLTVPDAGNATAVTLEEQVGASRQPISDQTPANGAVVVRHAEIWRCERRDRSFVATAAFPDGTTQAATAAIKTPSCARRFRVSARKLRGRVRAVVRDRWKVGDAKPRLCVKPPGGRTSCRSLAIPGGGTSARRDVRTRSSGLWRIAAGDATRVVYVRPRGKLRMLATGDSMIQIVDSYLKERLRGIRVRSDARVSTGLSKPFLLNWPRHAKRQARGVRPDVTVVFLGANDGFSFGSVDCCGDAWVDAYSKRVEAMMRAYSRGGRSLVYWLTLPAPRPAQWRPIYPAVNRAIKRAAGRLNGMARVVDLARTFTPNGRFRQTMRWHGRTVSVRQPDGVHLSPAGASIAEAVVARMLRKDGAL